MLIVVDGYPGAGKTTLIKRLRDVTGATAVGEVLDPSGETMDHYGRREQSPAETVAALPMILDSDLAKHRRARDLAGDGIILMDRNYAYTLAVCLVIGLAIEEEVFAHAVRWFHENRSALIRPDRYLVLAMPPELSDARTGWRPNPGNPMSYLGYRRIAGAYVESFRRVVEADVPVDVLDATAPAEDVAMAAMRLVARSYG